MWYSAPPASDAPCCAHDPNDACTPAAAAAWLQLADWYQWPHISYFDSPEEARGALDLAQPQHNHYETAMRPHAWRTLNALRRTRRVGQGPRPRPRAPRRALARAGTAA